MRTSTMMLLVPLLCVALAATGLWSFHTAQAPVPAKLATFAGIATNVQISTLRYSRSHATFQLKQANGQATEFSYRPSLKHFSYVAEHLKDGMAVEVTVGPNGPHDIWGMKLASQSLMNPDEAREARLAQGRWGLGLFVLSACAAIWMGRFALRLRRMDD